MTTDLIKTLEGFHRAKVLYPNDLLAITKLLPQIISALKDAERMREKLKPFADAWEFTQRDQKIWNGRIGGYPATEDYILDANFKEAYEAITPTADTKDNE